MYNSDITIRGMPMDFWNKIKDELEYKGISQKQFAEKLSINVQTLRNSISLDRLPDLETAYKMAQFLGLSLEYLISGKTEDIFPPNNIHLPTREIKLIENYRKLNDRDKLLIDTMASTMSSESHSSGFQIEDNSLGIVANFDDKTSLQK